jgi:type II secretory pathway component PulK
MKHMKCRRPAGLVLILVLVLIAMLALSSLGVAERMLSERKAVQQLGRQAQARALADSGVEMARQFLDRTRAAQDEAGGWYDNPRTLRDVLVLDDASPRDRGRFTLVAPRFQDRITAGTRFGLEDESARINLRTILKVDQAGEGSAKKILMALPGMTDSIAEAILDWIDEDATTRQQGAEGDYYSSITPAYAPRNAPPATIEELLLVRGVTPQLLFGLDAARMAGSAVTTVNPRIEGVDNSDGSMDHGWSAYLTLWSMESNLRPDGTPKINLNGDDLKKLYEDLEKVLGAEWATFIAAYRQNGSQGTIPPGQPHKPITTGKLDYSKQPSGTIGSVLDLVNARTSAKFEGAKENTVLDSPFSDDRSAMSDYLPKLLDNTTTSAGPATVGRINVNQAPRCVLAGIPGMTPDLLDQIIGRRVPDPATAGAARRYETWLLTEGLVPLDAMKKLLPYVTAGGSVFRVRAVGFFDLGGTTAHLEVLMDASKRPSSILFWKDVSHLAIGYSPTAAGPTGIQ